MDQDQGQERAQQLSDDPEPSVAQLRTEIEETREELGDTVEALAAKTDVKTRAHEKADELKQKVAGAMPSSGGNGSTTSSGGGGPAAVLTQIRTKAQENPVPTAALGALVGGFVIGRLTSRGG